MASEVQDPKYTLLQFSEDLAAFPELSLYLLEDSVAMNMSSGRTIGDEYQRTVGAFFAIYWLMRFELDGKAGFCFGVDEDWVPVNPKKCSDRRMYPKDKRLAFHKEANWKYIRKLLIDANLLKEERHMFTRGSTVTVNEHRLVSLL